ncbi:hypothetical protein ACQ4PT_013222 [Festuca glaucescens]
MSHAKRAIIAKTPFKHLLNVASFAAPPMELSEYVVKHTNPKLREFRHKTMSILFTRDMVLKVLGVPSGNRPMVYLKRTQHSELRDLFKNDKGRATIAKAIDVLENCADTVEALVVQSFGLIAFATVLCPGTANLVKCEYLGSLMDANEIHKYAIDEHILKETMGEVALFKEKLLTRSKLDPSQIVWIAMCLPMLVTIYMDFLSFPPLGPKEHTINPSTPRFCYVCDEDFRLVVEIDKNKLSLDPAAFGDRPLLSLSETLYAVVAPANAHQPHVDPVVGGDDGMGSEEVEVPEHLQGVYKKHQDLYATDIGAALHNFGQFLKAANAKRMAALLVDVHAANVASSSFTIPCPAAPDVHAKEPSSTMVEEDVVVENVGIEEALDIGEASHMARSEPSRVPSPNPSCVASPVPSTELTEPSHVPSPEHSLVASPASTEESEPTIASPSKWPPGFWDDAPSMELFEPRFDDAKFFATIPDIPRKDQFVAVATSGGSSVVVTPVCRKDAAQSIGPAASTIQEAQENVSSGPNTHDKKQRQKRAAKEIDTPPRMKKMKLTDTHQATYRKYIGHIRKITNFGALIQETQAFSIDITKLKRGAPADYPQQPNPFDCEFFTIFYMDKFDGKVMENFNENGIPYFRKILATDLIDHPMNTEDFAKVFEEETYE